MSSLKKLPSPDKGLKFLPKTPEELLAYAWGLSVLNQLRKKVDLACAPINTRDAMVLTVIDRLVWKSGSPQSPKDFNQHLPNHTRKDQLQALVESGWLTEMSPAKGFQTVRYMVPESRRDELRTIGNRLTDMLNKVRTKLQEKARQSA